VYAIVNRGWYEKYVVLEPKDDGCYLKTYEFLDKSEKGPHYPVNIQIITCDEPEDWIVETEDSLQEIHNSLNWNSEGIKFDYFRGFAWLLRNTESITSLLSGNPVKIDSDNITDTRLGGWNYIDNQEDIVLLLSQSISFHDAVLTKMEYVSGSGKAADGIGMVPFDSVRRVTMYLDSCWCPTVEMVFEGVTAMNLRPNLDNYLSDIFGAVLELQEEKVTFCLDEDVIDSLPDSVTWIKALSLRWRFITQSTVISDGPAIRSPGIPL
jgi:hypothetical protein